MNNHKGIIAALLLGALGLAACGSEVAPTATPAGPRAPLATDNLIGALVSTVQAGDVHDALDSTPNGDATTIYFTASGAHGPGIFRVPSAGGTAAEVAAGAPFVAPRALAMSPDGGQIFVTDPGAANGGQIFMLAPTGGVPAPVRGSAGTAPQNLTLVSQGGQATIYFTGKEPGSGQPAVLKLAASGADAPQIVAQGAPLTTPDGVAVTAAGTVYVTDRAAAGGALGKVFKIDGGAVTAIVDRVRTGDPAGVTLTPDETVLLVSAVQEDKPGAQVLVVALSTGQTGLITQGISQNPGAGGLHASPGKKTVLSWCGRNGPPGGGIGFSGALGSLAGGLLRTAAGNPALVYRIDLK